MRDILFMGSVLASVTHDMQNVMAIIKESGALTDDILQINGPPKLKHGDKLAVALANIQEQVQRGRSLMLMLNGFAHAAADYPEACDLGRCFRQIGLPVERQFRLRECSFGVECDDATLTVKGNAFLVMQALYRAMEGVLAVCSKGDAVTAALDGAVGGAVQVRLAAKNIAHVPDTVALAPLMEEIGGSCEAAPGSLCLRFILAGEGGGA